MVPTNFPTTLQYETSAAAAEIMADMEQLAALDRVYERQESNWKLLMVLGFAGGFLGLLIVSAYGWGWSLTFPAAAFLLAGLAVIRRRACQRLNLDNHRYRLVGRVFEYLSTDIAPDHPCHIHIDFNDYHQQKYRTTEPGGRGRTTTALSSYRLPWLQCEGRLMDGNHFSLSTTLVVKRKTRRKRKYTKVREVFRENVLLKLRTRERPHCATEHWPERVARSPFPPAVHGLQFHGARRRGAWLLLSAVTEPQVRIQGRSGTTGANATEALSNVHGLLGMFLVCYHALAQCEAGR